MGARHVTFSRIRNRFSPTHTPATPFPSSSSSFLRTASRAPRTLAACLSGHRLSPATAPPIHADLTQSEAQGASRRHILLLPSTTTVASTAVSLQASPGRFFGGWQKKQQPQNELKPKKISQIAESPFLLDSFLPSQLIFPPTLLLLLPRPSSLVNLLPTNREGLTWPTPRLKTSRCTCTNQVGLTSTLLRSRWHWRLLKTPSYSLTAGLC